MRLLPKTAYPIIGVTTGEVLNLERPNNPFVYGQGHDYTLAIEKAGGVPLLVPSMEDMAALDKLYELMDGILLAGGNDVDPALYNEESHRAIEGISKRRDATETYLIERAQADKKPMLGICRGTQIWNIVNGGTLFQHLPDHIESSLDHINSGKLLPDRLHEVELIKPSVLASILLSEDHNEPIYVDSHHHQAINKLGDGLKIASRAEDGVIEAIETTDEDWFAVAVQWHPESMYKAFGPLFEELAAASYEWACASRHAVNRL